MNGLNPTGFIAILLIGLSLIQSVRIIYGPGIRSDFLSRLMVIIGWVLCLISLQSLILFTGTWVGTFLWFSMVVIGLAAANWFRRSERRALLWTLGHATDAGLPVLETLQAFAADRSTSSGLDRVIRYVENGAPLDVAFRQAKYWLPIDDKLAMMMGGFTGAVDESLRRIGAQMKRHEEALNVITSQFVYLAVVGAVFLGIQSFIAIMIMPRFERMFVEFEIDLPLVTQVTLTVSGFYVKFFFLILPLKIVLFALVAAVVGHYAGILPIHFWPFADDGDHPRRNANGCIEWVSLAILAVLFFPLALAFWSYKFCLGIITRRLDRGRLLGALALATTHEKTYAETIEFLAQNFPRRALRKKLSRASQALAQGQPWLAALQAHGLVSRADAAVLDSAERAGNLPWALEEMADANVRRHVFRMRVLSNIAFPLSVICMGGVMLVLALAVFQPLTQLIESGTQ